MTLATRTRSARIGGEIGRVPSGAGKDNDTFKAVPNAIIKSFTIRNRGIPITRILVRGKHPLRIAEKSVTILHFDLATLSVPVDETEEMMILDLTIEIIKNDTILRLITIPILGLDIRFGKDGVGTTRVRGERPARLTSVRRTPKDKDLGLDVSLLHTSLLVDNKSILLETRDVLDGNLRMFDNCGFVTRVTNRGETGEHVVAFTLTIRTSTEFKRTSNTLRSRGAVSTSAHLSTGRSTRAETRTMRLRAIVNGVRNGGASFNMNTVGTKSRNNSGHAKRMRKADNTLIMVARFALMLEEQPGGAGGQRRPRRRQADFVILLVASKEPDTRTRTTRRIEQRRWRSRRKSRTVSNSRRRSGGTGRRGAAHRYARSSLGGKKRVKRVFLEERGVIEEVMHGVRSRKRRFVSRNRAFTGGFEVNEAGAGHLRVFEE